MPTAHLQHGDIEKLPLSIARLHTQYPVYTEFDFPPPTCGVVEYKGFHAHYRTVVGNVLHKFTTHSPSLVSPCNARLL